MQWDSFVKTLHDADNKMREILNDFPRYHNFLKKNYPVVTYKNKRINLNKELSIFDIVNNIELAGDSPLKNDLLNLIHLLQEARAAKNNIDKKDSKDIDNRIKKYKAEISFFPLKDLDIIDDFDVQLIFPTVNMSVIQSVKKHPLVNKEKTCLCKACIRVYLY